MFGIGCLEGPPGRVEFELLLGKLWKLSDKMNSSGDLDAGCIGSPRSGAFDGGRWGEGMNAFMLPNSCFKPRMDAHDRNGANGDPSRQELRPGGCWK